MRVTPAGCGLAAAVLMLAAGGPAAADEPYSPARANIEAACNAVVKEPKGTRVVYLARLRPGGTEGSWQRSDEKTNARIEDGSLGPGDAVKVRQSDTVLLAILTSFSDGDAAGRTRAWCYLGGQLSRADVELPDTEAGVMRRRAEYFESDPEKPTSDVQDVRPMLDSPVAKPVPKASPEKLLIDAYQTPSKLPFYEAYRSALARRSPTLR